MNCPRCIPAGEAGLARCPACAAPLLLADEPSPRALDRALDLDRRGPWGHPWPDAVPAIERAREPEPETDLPPVVTREPELDVVSLLEREPAFDERSAFDEEPALRSPQHAARIAGQGGAGEEDESAEPGAWDGPGAEPGRGEAPDIEPRGEAPELAEVIPALESPPPTGGLGARTARAAAPHAHAPEVRLACAPLERRLVAWAIDGAVLFAALAPALLVTALVLPRHADRLAVLGVPAVALAALLGFAYGALAHALMGATLGQRLCGLRVAGADGASPGMARSAGRAALAAVGTAAFGLGLLPALLGRTGRGLHDFLAGTVVVRATP